MVIEGLYFVLTSAVCPEQYDVFHVGNQVGYVRLRHGCLRCYYPDCGGDIIYRASFDDEWKGCFDDEGERMKYLTEIAVAINERRADDRK